MRRANVGARPRIASHNVGRIAYNLRNNYDGQKVKGPYTVKSVNDAFKAIQNYKTAMLCKPFTYGNYSEHIPNNADYTVTPSASGGTMVVAQGCTEISAADPQIAAYRKLAGS